MHRRCKGSETYRVVRRRSTHLRRGWKNARATVVKREWNGRAVWSGRKLVHRRGLASITFFFTSSMYNLRCTCKCIFFHIHKVNVTASARTCISPFHLCTSTSVRFCTFGASAVGFDNLRIVKRGCASSPHHFIPQGTGGYRSQPLH